MYEEVLKTILENKLIVVLRGVKQDEVLPLTEALVLGGVKCIEVSINCDDENSSFNIIKSIKEKYSERICVGAGTVLNDKQVKTAKNYDVDFIVSPSINNKVVKITKKFGLVSIAGAITPTEVTLCNKLSVDIIKLFPAGNFGAKLVSSLSSPFNKSRFFAFGGITIDNIESFVKNKTAGFGVSEGIVDKKLLYLKDFESIKNNAEKYVNKIKELYND